MVDTVAEAYEALRPIEVVKADYVGLPVVRQGDIFGIETLLTTGELRSMGAVFAKRSTLANFSAFDVSGDIVIQRPGAETERSILRERLALEGTNHTATEVATLPDGKQYARGSLYHAPRLLSNENRAADHARRKLGDGKAWHEIRRNTVPQSFGAPQAWSGFGRVD